MNSVILIGRLTADPELRFFNTGVAISKITLAINRSYRKDSQVVTDFIPVEIWGKKAEYCATYIEKGCLVAISGSLHIDRFIDSTGNNRNYAKVVANSIIKLNTPNKNNGGNEINSSETTVTNSGGDVTNSETTVANTNIGGTALMLDILTNAKHNVKRVIVAESRAIYGEGKYYSPLLGKDVYPEERLDENMCKGEFECTYPDAGKLELVATTEDSKIHPSSVYGITKQVQGQLAHLVCPSIGIDAVSYRYQNVYGPGQSLSNPYTGILSIFSTRIKNGNEINIFEDGKETRDFVFIEDVVDATILGLETKEAAGHAFNIGTGVSTDVLTVANTLCEKYNIKVPISISGNYRLGDIRHNYANITLARTILGYEPKWSFSDGIGEFCKWVNTQEIQADMYDASILEMKEKGLYK